MNHFLRKLLKTLRIVITLALARTFGRYECSVWSPSGLKYAKYHWRGEVWAFPTEPMDEEEYTLCQSEKISKR